MTKENYYLNKNTNIIPILIIADSVRSKSMQVLGYEQQKTNPNLLKLQKDNKIMVFNSQACYTQTNISVNCILRLETSQYYRNIAQKFYHNQ